MKSKQGLIFIILMFLLTISFAYANPTEGVDIQACSCSIFSNSFEIHNSGTSIDTFRISQRGTAAGWSNIFPDTIILEPGESVKVDNLINPPCASQGDFSLITVVESGVGIETILQSLTVERCSNIEVVFKDLTQSGCNCSVFEYEFSITNTGNYNEVYTMKLLEDVGTAAANVYNPIILGAGESKNVKLSVVPECDVFDEVSTVFRISTKESGYHADAPLALDIEACPALAEEEIQTPPLTRLRPMLILIFVLLLLLFLSLVLYYAVFSGERLYYRKVGVKEPKISKPKELKITVDDVVNNRNLKLILALVILLIVAFFIFNFIQTATFIAPMNETLMNESIEEIPEPVNQTQDAINETGDYVLDGEPFLKRNLSYLYYIAVGLAILFLVLLVKIKLDQEPRKKVKKSKKTKKKPVFPKIRKWAKGNWKILVAVLMLIVIIILAYFFRANIASAWVVVKDFLAVYLAFIMMGFVLLGILLFALAKLRKS